jgi:hypothetical protein
MAAVRLTKRCCSALHTLNEAMRRVLECGTRTWLGLVAVLIAVLAVAAVIRFRVVDAINLDNRSRFRWRVRGGWWCDLKLRFDLEHINVATLQRGGDTHDRSCGGCCLIS